MLSVPSRSELGLFHASSEPQKNAILISSCESNAIYLPRSPGTVAISFEELKRLAPSVFAFSANRSRLESIQFSSHFLNPQGDQGKRSGSGSCRTGTRSHGSNNAVARFSVGDLNIVKVGEGRAEEGSSRIQEAIPPPLGPLETAQSRFLAAIGRGRASVPSRI